MKASTTLKVIKGDVSIQFKASGVDNPSGAFGDPAGPYNGPGTGIAGIRITDDDCTVSPCTVKDIPFPVPSPPTGCTNGKCSVKTTANAVLPNAVKVGKAGVVAIGYPAPLGTQGPIQISDEGGNIALVQGLFLP
jgi:hypothetical protein